MTGKVGHCYVMLNNGVSFTVLLNLLHFLRLSYTFCCICSVPGVGKANVELDKQLKEPRISCSVHTANMTLLDLCHSSCRAM